MLLPVVFAVSTSLLSRFFPRVRRSFPTVSLLDMAHWLRLYIISSSHRSSFREWTYLRLSGCHPWRFIQLQAVATYQTDVTRTSCCGLHLYYASSPRPAVSLSCRESCVNGSRLPAEQLRHIEESTK